MAAPIENIAGELKVDEMDEIPDELNLTSPKLDPFKVLYSRNVYLPHKNPTTFNNLAEYENIVIRGNVRPAKPSTTRRGRGRDHKPHIRERIVNLQQEENTDDSDTTEKDAAIARLAERRKKMNRNVLNRMTGYEKGPMTLLKRVVEERLRVKIWTRSAVTRRGYCLAYIIAFDKHFNLALMDVDETYRIPRIIRKPRKDVPKVSDKNIDIKSSKIKEPSKDQDSKLVLDSQSENSVTRLVGDSQSENKHVDNLLTRLVPVSQSKDECIDIPLTRLVPDSQSENECIDIPLTRLEPDSQSENECIDIPLTRLVPDSQSENECIDIPLTRLEPDSQSENECIDIPLTRLEPDSQSENECIDIPLTRLVPDSQSENECIDIPLTRLEPDSQSENECIDIPLTRLEPDSQSENECIDIPLTRLEPDSQSENECIDIPLTRLEPDSQSENEYIDNPVTRLVQDNKHVKYPVMSLIPDYLTDVSKTFRHDSRSGSGDVDEGILVKKQTNTLKGGNKIVTDSLSEGEDTDTGVAKLTQKLSIRPDRTNSEVSSHEISENSALTSFTHSVETEKESADIPDTMTSLLQTEEDFTTEIVYNTKHRHVNQLFVRGDNVVSIVLID